MPQLEQTPQTSTVPVEIDPDTARIFRQLSAVLTGQTTEKPTAHLAPRLQRLFGTEAGGLVGIEVAPSWPRFWLLSREVGRLAGEYEAVRVVGGDLSFEPEWRLMNELGDLPVLESACVWFPAGTLGDVPVAVEVEGARPFQSPSLRVHVRLEDSAFARELIDRLSGSVLADNPWRLGVVRVTGDHSGVMFHRADVAAMTRGDLILPDAVWTTIDADVHRLLERRDRLTQAGLKANRGLLLAGPPGTGKTALAHVLANELAGQASVVLCDTSVVGARVRQLYDTLDLLAPAVVVLDDIDLLTRHRDEGGWAGGEVLHSLLTTLDGAMTQHDGVVTIASTNTPEVLDPALRRACRFDRVITLACPDPSLRARLLTRLAGRAGCLLSTNDLETLVAATEGASGADLTELVRLAVLAGDDDAPRPHDLVAAAQAGTWRATDVMGTYL